MSNNTLNAVTNGAVTPDMWNQFLTALINDFVGRNSSGAAESGKKNGTATIPWGEMHTDRLYLDGKLLDPDNIGSSSSSNGIVSGQTRADSIMPDFIRADGSAASFSVLAASTALNVNIASVGVSVQTDLTLGSLNTAPSTNNTALINDTSLAGGSTSKYVGENGTSIAIDNAGTEITDRDSQYAAFKHGTSEIFIAKITDVSGTTAVLKNIRRGYFFDSSGTPLERETMSDNDSITLLNLAWVFLQNNGTTLDVTYRTPVWSHNEPISPQTDDYWLDLQNDVWKRYNGSEFEEINRLLLGLVVLDTTSAIASRSVDFTKSFSDHIELEVTNYDNTHVYSDGLANSLSVYGNYVDFGFSPATWDITTDIESGQSETTSQFLYLYITEEGKTVLSEIRPYNRENDLRGWYHPYHTWRYVGVAYNNSSSDIDGVNSHNKKTTKEQVFTSNGTYLPIPNKTIKVTVQGTPGGNGNGSGGSTSSFGSYVSATGGGKGGNAVLYRNTSSGTVNYDAVTGGGGGGGGIGGDINLSGQTGGSTMAINGTVSAGVGGSSSLGRDAGASGATYNVGSNYYIIGAGGGGGCAIKWLNNLEGAITVTIGTVNGTGFCLIEEF